MSLRVRLSATLAVGLALGSPDLFAHEGHGDSAWYGSLAHHLLEPSHALPTLASLIALVIVRRRLGRRTSARRMRQA